MGAAARTGKPTLMIVHTVGGPPLDLVLPRVARLAAPVLVALVPLGADLTRLAAELDVPVRTVTASRGEALVAELTALGREITAAGVLGLSEFAQVTTARVAERLGLPGAGSNVLRARDKLLMRETWAAAGLPNPRFRAVGSPAELAAALTAFGEPALLKSRTGAGSIGLTPVPDATHAETAWAAARAGLRAGADRHALELADDLDPAAVLAETVIPGSTDSWYETSGYGDYLSVEGLVVGGVYHPVCITGRIPTVEPFTELSNLAPSVLPEPLQRLVEQSARAAVDALGLDTCGTHTELKLLAGNGLCLLESAARLGGALIVREVETVFGVDLVTQLTRALLGLPVDLPGQMLTTGRGAAASVALIATNAAGEPWRRRPPFDPARIELGAPIDPRSRAEVARAQSIPAGAMMPSYDASFGLLNFAGLLFLESPDPHTQLADVHGLLDGLEDLLGAVPPPDDQTGPEAVSYLTEVPGAAETAELFRVAELNGPLDDLPRLRRMLAEAQDMLCARAPDGQLIGFVRVLTDFSFNAFVADLAVHPKWQRQGIGGHLVRAVTETHPGVKFVVHPGHDSHAFWARHGFGPADCLVRGRHA